MGDKAYTNVRDLVRELTNDSELIDAVEDALDRQNVMRQLMAMRAVAGLSQSDVAKSMGCSQSRVSKMEKSADDRLRYGDLRRYAQAVGCELKSGVKPENMKPADEVKCLAFAINDRLTRMAKLAQDDRDIATGAARFFVEAYVNFSMIVGRAASALPQNPDGSPRIAIHVDVIERPEDTKPTSSSGESNLLQSVAG